MCSRDHEMLFLSHIETAMLCGELGLQFVGITDAKRQLLRVLTLIDSGAFRGVRCNKEGMVPGTKRSCSISISDVGGIVICTEMADFYLDLHLNGGGADASSFASSSSYPPARTTSSASALSPREA